jgi:hypothetical protein
VAFLPIVGQGVGVDGVGFPENAEGADERLDLPDIGSMGRDACTGQRIEEARLVASLASQTTKQSPLSVATKPARAAG